MDTNPIYNDRQWQPVNGSNVNSAETGAEPDYGQAYTPTSSVASHGPVSPTAILNGYSRESMDTLVSTSTVVPNQHAASEYPASRSARSGTLASAASVLPEDDQGSPNQITSRPSQPTGAFVHLDYSQPTNAADDDTIRLSGVTGRKPSTTFQNNKQDVAESHTLTNQAADAAEILEFSSSRNANDVYLAGPTAARPHPARSRSDSVVSITSSSIDARPARPARSARRPSVSSSSGSNTGGVLEAFNPDNRIRTSVRTGSISSARRPSVNRNIPTHAGPSSSAALIRKTTSASHTAAHVDGHIKGEVFDRLNQVSQQHGRPQSQLARAYSQGTASRRSSFNANLPNMQDLTSHSSLTANTSCLTTGTSIFTDLNSMSGANSVTTDPRSSVYSAVSSSEFERDREREIAWHINCAQGGLHQHPNASGFFELEGELAKHSSVLDRASQYAVSASAPVQLSVPAFNDTHRPASPATPGFGLGITADAAIYPDQPEDLASMPVTGINSQFSDQQKQPSALPSLPHSSGVQYAFEAVVAVPTATTDASPSVSPQQSHASRWSTTRSYVPRRNTSSSTRSAAVSRTSSFNDLQVQARLDLQAQSRLPVSPHLYSNARRPSPSRQILVRQPSFSLALKESVETDQAPRQLLDKSLAASDATEELVVGSAPLQTEAMDGQSTLRSQYGRTRGMSASSTRSYHVPAPLQIMSGHINHPRTRTQSSHKGRENSLSAFDNTLHSAAASAALATLSYAESNRSSEDSWDRAVLPQAFTDGPAAAALEEKLGRLLDVQPGIRALSVSEGQAVSLVEKGIHILTKLQVGQVLHEMEIPVETTHLELSGCRQPLELTAKLQTALPNMSSNLVVLDVSFCNLTCLPDVISICSHLEELNVSFNPLSSGALPQFLSFLKSLRVLVADNCGLTNLSRSLAPLMNLHTVSLRNNALRALPSWLSQLRDSLETLLVDGNPFVADYAELCAPLLKFSAGRGMNPPAVAAPPYTGHAGAATFDVNSEHASLPTLCDLYSQHQGPTTVLPNPQPSPNPTPLFASPTLSNGSERSSVFERARTLKNRLRRPSLLGNSDQGFSSNRLDSSLLQDAGSLRSPPSRRSSILRSMKSTGDLTRPSPSLQSLIEFDHRDQSGLSRSNSFYNTHNAVSPRADHSDTEDHAASSVASEDEGDQDNAEVTRSRKPSLFKRITGKLSRKRSAGPVAAGLSPESSVKSPLPTQYMFETAGGRGGALSAVPPFMTDDTRSVSDPTISLSQRMRKSVSRPSIVKSGSSMNASRKPGKGSKIPVSPPMDVPFAACPTPVTSPTVKMNRRRSYLMLNSPLPPVLSPGPLTLSWGSSHPEETGNASSPIETINEEETINISRYMASPVTMQPIVNQKAEVAEPETTTEQRRLALAPLLAYLQDLYELWQSAEVLDPNKPSQNETAPHTPSLGNTSRVVSRKPSLAAISSTASSKADRTSGYDSSKGYSTGVTSPTSVQTPIVSKDNPVKRERIISEIVASERSYLAGLQELVTLYIQPASAPLKSIGSGSIETVVSMAERRRVFGCVENIIDFHANVFLPELERAARPVLADRASNSSLDDAALRRAARAVAEVFIQHAAFLKLYHSYCLNYEMALNRLSIWKSFATGASATTESGATSPQVGGLTKSPSFNISTQEKKRIRHLLKHAKRDLRHSQIDLQSYLLLPIQRIPRYRMLLENLVGCTPDSVDSPLPDSQLSQALEAMSSLANEMNERKRDNEGRQRLLYWHHRIDASFGSPLVQPHRTLLKEGQMTLSRVAKRVTTVVSGGKILPDSSVTLQKIEVLNLDVTTKNLTYLLCSDMLVFVLTPDGDLPSTPVELFTVLRLGKSIGGPDRPAAIFGDQTLRIRDARAILYLRCSTPGEAAECRDIINQQSEDNEVPFGTPEMLSGLRP